VLAQIVEMSLITPRFWSEGPTPGNSGAGWWCALPSQRDRFMRALVAWYPCQIVGAEVFNEVSDDAIMSAGV